MNTRHLLVSLACLTAVTLLVVWWVQGEGGQEGPAVGPSGTHAESTTSESSSPSSSIADTLVVKPSPEDLEHGRAQLRAMLKDRPAMAEHAEHNSGLYSWTVMQFAGAGGQGRIEWTKELPPFGIAAAFLHGSTSGGAKRIAVAPREAGDSSDSSPCRAFENLWWCFIFEVCNALNYERFIPVRIAAVSGLIERDEWKRRTGEIEEDSGRRARTLYLELLSHHIDIELDPLALEVNRDAREHWGPWMDFHWQDTIAKFRQAFAAFVAQLSENFDAAHYQETVLGVISSDNADLGLRMLAIEAAGLLGARTPSPREALRACLTDNDYLIRWSAVRALAQLTPLDETDISMLKERCKDESEDVRKAAQEALRTPSNTFLVWVLVVGGTLAAALVALMIRERKKSTERDIKMRRRRLERRLKKGMSLNVPTDTEREERDNP